MAETGARTRLPAWQWARRLLRNRVTPVGLIIVAAAVVTAVAAPVLVPYDPMAMRTQAILQGPSRAHVLGTDQFGRDILSRIIIGARVSLLVAVLSV
ncbi:MAG: ABC transporter permease, partial [Armatimonadota bacterium]|nr:ABC transporter permease [Armatimonadota bacterium]